MHALSGRKNWPVVIDEQGVHYASPGQITWAEIAGLEPVRSRQRVDLRDAHGRVRVSLPYDLEDAHEVVQFVADMLADRWPEVPLPHEFGQDLPMPTLAAGASAIAALGGAIYLMRGRPLVQLLCAVAMALVVELEGFRQFAQRGLVLNAGQKIDLPVTLQIGQLTDSVTVTGALPLLRTTTAEVADVFGTREVAQLPLNGRQFLHLAQLSDGVVVPRRTRGSWWRTGSMSAASSCGPGSCRTAGRRRC